MKLRLLTSVAVAAAIVSVAATPSAAATIILNNIGGVDVGTQAYQGFTTAANFWASEIKNNITIVLDVGFGHLGPNILGSTGSTFTTELTQDVESHIVAGGTSSLDAIAAGHLPALTPSQFAGVGGLSMVTPGYTDPVAKTGIDNSKQVFDHDGSVNNVLTGLTTANAKALGFAVDPGQTDGSISFSSDFNFDFNPTNGISADAIDFVGVATHEIGHALGFTSGVDDYDVLGLPNGPLVGQPCLDDGTLCQNYPANDDWFGETLDLFRYGDTAVGGNALTWVPGVESCFSIDAGATCQGGFSTGEFNGDTWQASHWKRQPTGGTALGIMDPAVSFGQLDRFTDLDFQAFDAIGYNFGFDTLKDPQSLSTADISRMFRVAPLPEPTTWALLVMGVGLAGVSLRRRRLVAP
jgi:hypothetical protein